MAEFKHTPGPWEIETTGDVTEIIARINDVDSWFIATSISQCGSNSLPNNEETEANAKLIAAAPDLLEALLKVCEFLEFKNPQGMNVRSADYQLWAMCQPTITKATLTTQSNAE